MFASSVNMSRVFCWWALLQDDGTVSLFFFHWESIQLLMSEVFFLEPFSFSRERPLDHLLGGGEVDIGLAFLNLAKGTWVGKYEVSFNFIICIYI